MQVDFAIELGSDDESLELPWAAADGGPFYRDLKRQPGLLSEIEEAQREPALAAFLTAVNSPGGMLETAKCDTWSTDEMNPEEEIFSLPWKFGSYVDLLFSADDPRYSLPVHEELVIGLTGLLKRVPSIPASAEFLIRRCYYHDQPERDGFYVTFYLFGYGEDAEKARTQWQIGLKLVENAIRQLSRKP